jgi:alpha-glucosidase
MLDAPDGILSFIRQSGTDQLYCVFNMSEKAVVVPVPEGLVTAASGAPDIAPEPEGGSLSLAPFGAYIGVLR